MPKLFFFDLETTGTDAQVHGIHQISGAIVVDGQLKERFMFRVQPHPNCEIDPKALELNGTTLEDLNRFPAPLAVHNDLCRMLSRYVDRYHPKDKFHAAGYNVAAFDCPFLRKWFERCYDKYYGSWFWSSPIDVMVLAAQKLMLRRPDMENFKLHTVAAMLGVRVDESRLHDAEYDNHLTMCIYEQVTGLKVLCAKPGAPMPPMTNSIS